jgi:dipeptidyl aminopeptidase/acylaminoacyl peptidase
MAKRDCFAAGALVLVVTSGAFAQTAITYQKPSPAIEQLLDAPETPVAHISPDRTLLLIEQPATFPTIADVAQPRFRLAGLRFNPKTSSPSAETWSIGLKLQPIAGGPAKPVAGLPEKLKVTGTLWSPDSKHIAFYQRVDMGTPGLQLWVIDAAAAHAHRVGLVTLNSILGRPCEWMPDNAALLCKTVPTGRGPAPKISDVPTGPNVSESLGKVSPEPTYEDMIHTPEEENIFEYYSTSQLAIVPLAGPTKPLAVKGLINSVSPSPDGKYALVEAIHRPFSYNVPSQRFPLKAEIVTLKSGAVKDLSDRPLVDNLPISRDAVEVGPRDYQWRSDVPATIVWVEAADGGIPNPNAKVVDRVQALPAPFEGQPTTILETSLRLSRGGFGGARGLEWGTDHLAIATESRFSDRRTLMVAFDPSAPSTPGKLVTLYAGSSQDRYRNPGRPVTEINPSGHPILKLTADGKDIYFFSQGASPQGDMPFVATMPVTGGPESLLFHSGAGFYCDPIAILSDEKVLIRRESPTDSPNYFTASLIGANGDAAQTPVTHFPSPYAGIKMPTHQLLKYKRADGVDLTATLWLPFGYDKSQGPLPTLMEAYPAEFKTRAAASQVAGSPNRFPSVNWGSPIYFTQDGFAVLQNAAIPIIGEGKSEPNDTYVQQLVDGAKAAVDYGVSLGVVDPKRVAVMGHSYGAFMTANLLAHTDIFRAGIARSGAYNRTLTPYGFQNEERTYWQDPKVYYDMSPFSFADKIKAPILLIHGEADDNTGTYPIQSERFYAALKGQGATVRLVFLPLEPHHYGAHESLQHMLWEMDRWLDTYVKPEVPPTQKASN